MAASGDIIALISALGGGGGGGSATSYNELSNKPKLNNITIQGNQTAGDYGLFQQLETLPSAVSALVGKPPIQYIGTTTASLTHGYFYECKESTVTAGTYEWKAVTVQEGSETVSVDNVTIEYNGSSQLQIKDSGVSTAKLADGNVTYAKLDSTLFITSAADIISGAAVTNKVVTPKAVYEFAHADSTTIERDATNGLRIKDGGVTTAKLADNAVTTAKITDANVTIAKIDSGAIATSIRTSATAVDTKLTTEKAVRTELDLKVNVADIKDVLTDASTNKPLSANQGKVLNTIIGSLSDLTTTIKSSVVNAINELVTKFSDYIKKTDVDGSTVEINGTTNKLQIKNSGVGTAKLADASVTTDKINANAVTLAKIDSAVFVNTALTGNTTAVNLEVSGTFNSTSTASLNDVTVSGDIEVPTPTSNVQAANKRYVDDSIAAVSGGAFTFRGFMSSTAPAATYDLREGNLWYLGTTMPTVFPIAVYRYTSGAWSTTTENYTPNALDMWSDINPSATVEIYYFNGQWKALDPTAIQVDNTSIGKNASNQLEIKASGVTTAKVQDGSITKAKIDAAANVVYTADAQTLTYKTIDVDSNTVSNIEVDNLKASAVATSIGAVPVNTKLTTEKAVADGLDLKLNIADVDGSTLEIDGTTNQLQIKDSGVSTAKLADASVTKAKLDSNLIATTLSSASTDNHFPTAKAVYDYVKVYSGASGIEITDANAIQHTNSVTAVASQTLAKVAYDEQGHITGSTEVTADRGIDITSNAIGHTNSVTARTTAALGTVKFDANGHITEFTEKAVVDNLTSTATDQPLSAKQGKQLEDTKLALAGGTMTGAIVHGGVTNMFLKRNDNTHELHITGGNTNGATITLVGGENTLGDAGKFQLLANDADNTVALVGKPDGTLTWNGKTLANTEQLDNKANKATTLAGYGIADAYTKTECNNKFATLQQVYDLIHPINEIVFGFQAPSTTGVSATWTDISSTYNGRYFKVSSTQAAGTSEAEQLPNIKGALTTQNETPSNWAGTTGALSVATMTESDGYTGHSANTRNRARIDFNAHNSNSIYTDGGAVRPLTTIIKVWKRTA